MTSVPQTQKDWNEVGCWADSCSFGHSGFDGRSRQEEVGNEGFVVENRAQAALSAGNGLCKHAAFLSGTGA